MLLKIIRTDFENPDFAALVKLLDAELAERDGSEHAFYSRFNKIDALKQAIVAYVGELPIACGAIKQLEPGVMEVKRMYTKPEYRGKGIAAKILAELEKWASELSCSKCRLETGKRQPEAIALYTKSAYHVIPNYGQYLDVENSVCFEKNL